MDEGYIKLFRSLQNWEWYLDSNTKDVFIHLLINANWEDYRFMGYEIPRGSLVTSYSSLSRDLRLSIKSVRTAIKHLKKTGEVTVKVTNKFSIITIENWEKFQGAYEDKGKQNGRQNGIQVAVKGQSKGNNKEYKNKELKNIKEEYKEENSPSISNTMEDIQNLFNSICIFFEPCSVITKTRLEKIKILLQKYSYEDIKDVFEKANACDFLLGKNDRGWKASFDWLIDIDNFVKVKEENYKSTSMYKAPATKPKDDVYRGYTFEELEREIKGER